MFAEAPDENGQQVTSSSPAEWCKTGAQPGAQI
jgi:hypothetical protein